MAAISIGLTILLGIVLIITAYLYYNTTYLGDITNLLITIFSISSLIVANVFLWTATISTSLRTERAGAGAAAAPPVTTQQTRLSDIIRDDDGFPSLARLQFFTWTLIVFFAFLAIFFIKWYNGTPELPETLPNNLLILMGISIAVPIISSGVSRVKYGNRPSISGTLGDSDRRSLSTMLMENGQFAISRFQMFAWTWITVISYLIVFGSEAISFMHSPVDLQFPDVSQIYIALMGLSQGAYIGSKMLIPKSFAITGINPASVTLNEVQAGMTIIIMGINFDPVLGTRIWFEPKSGQTWIGPVLPGQNSTSDRIEVMLPNMIVVGEYYVRVERTGLRTDRMIDEKTEAKLTVT